MNASETIIFDWDYFCVELKAFRDLMGSKGYTLEQRQNAFMGLCYIALRCKDPRVKEAMRAVTIDYEMRMMLLMNMKKP